MLQIWLGSSSTMKRTIRSTLGEVIGGTWWNNNPVRGRGNVPLMRQRRRHSRHSIGRGILTQSFHKNPRVKGRNLRAEALWAHKLKYRTICAAMFSRECRAGLLFKAEWMGDSVLPCYKPRGKLKLESPPSVRSFTGSQSRERVAPNSDRNLLCKRYFFINRFRL